MFTGVSRITRLRVSVIFACLSVLLVIMSELQFPCGEDCSRAFPSLRGLNQHCLKCQVYNTGRVRLMESLSVPVCIPEKRPRSSSEVSHQSL